MQRILPVIVISQFFCTSLWFAGNAILPDIIQQFRLASSFTGNLASAVQFGFISGTLIFALLAISDRYRPAGVFFVCAVIAAICNLGICIENLHATGLLLFRFLTGFFLAGIYPVGMKIASDHYKEGLGKSLGFLVGALVIGTAFPHLLKSFTASLPFKYVVLATSFLSVLGGAAMLLLVPDGPYRKPAQRLQLAAFFTLFHNRGLRTAAFGYFGHMWELYTFWVFVPVMLAGYQKQYPANHLNIPLLSFAVIASGSIACVAGGLLSKKIGARKIAATALFVSGCCCLLSPFFLWQASFLAFLVFLFVWALAVIADSPLFSALVAQEAPAASRGAALTIVNCIGFAITIISIQLTNILVNSSHSHYLFMILAIGPLAGLAALFNGHSKIKATPN